MTHANDYLKKNLRPGFTFIELIIALAILAVLSVVIIPGTFRYLKQSKITKTTATLNTFRTAITSYYASVGKYPNSLNDLLKKPADVPLKKWVAPFLDLEEVPQDAWGNDFVYRLNSKNPQRPYELYSYGPNGPEASQEEMLSVWE